METMAAPITAVRWLSCSATSDIEILNLFLKRAMIDFIILLFSLSELTPGKSSFTFRVTVVKAMHYLCAIAEFWQFPQFYRPRLSLRL